MIYGCCSSALAKHPRFVVREGLSSTITTLFVFDIPAAGDIKLRPGTASEPAFPNYDADMKTGKAKGMF